jgi:hypothetical protein
MDVLHFLKTNHDTIRAELARLVELDGVKARRAELDELARAVQMHLVLERDYLYPEVSGLFSGAEALVTAGLAEAAVIEKRLKAITKLAAKPAAEQDGFDKRLDELRAAVIGHFDQEEQMLMPKIRELIRTEDREDLGQVFLDAKADALAAAPGTGDDAGSQRAPQRKRA